MAAPRRAELITFPDITQLKPSDPIIYPYEQLPAAGEARELLPGLRWLRMPLPFELNHINLWLLEEADGWTIVDTGLNLDDIKANWEAVLAAHCRAKPVKRIIVTHCHPDHLGLARWLGEKTGAGTWITQGELLNAYAWFHQLPNYDVEGMVGFFRRHGLDAERTALLEGRGPTYRGRVDGLPVEYRRLMEGELLRIGGNDWRVIVGYGHSPEHASLHCAELGVLISGDMLLPRISTNVSAMSSTPDGDPLGWFLDSIERLTELPEDTLVLPSHGKPFRGIHARAAQLAAHHEERFAALLAVLDAPKSACELIPTLFSRALDAHQTMFAMGEAIAHLNYLEHAGRVRRSSGADGVVRFVAV
ncbi:MAG: MBL fold metallo-hydrolase [Rhodocyclaceae bacterium]|jgi:glyoxylase-like metal-dependent hydrolase (beta-lactamase superfamily II)|nr:MBL fold metallo-hydrolase [Rhodocyclaceae bacterium]MCC6878485.1 MBL fold metallo-hydrolase [Rhodocyclaceae bacterium]MCL4680753.1 MBL fold metallo-hydrolase [Rhodocyclaceae bacterium]